MTLLRYSWEAAPRCAFSKGRYGEEKYLLALPGIEPRFLAPPPRSLIAILREVLGSKFRDCMFKYNKTNSFQMFCYSLLIIISPIHSPYKLVSALNSSVRESVISTFAMHVSRSVLQ
jgi:hypothetical protein